MIYLGSSCYPRTLTYLKDCRVQTKQKRTQKQSYKMHPLLLEMEATLMFQQMLYIDAYINFISVTCSPHNAKTTIGRYQRTNRPILIIGKMADNRLIPIIDRGYFDTTRNGNHYSFLTPKLVGGGRPLPSEICAESDPCPLRKTPTSSSTDFRLQRYNRKR